MVVSPAAAAGIVSFMSEARVPEEDSIRPESGAMPPSRTDDAAGPTPEEEIRGAQPPNDSSDDSVREHDTRETGNVADVVDIDQVDETGSLRSAHNEDERSDEAARHLTETDQSS